MRVNPSLLHQGGNESLRAGSHADDGVDRLTGTSPTAGMFGSFDAAETFHAAVAEAHTQHTTALRTHGETLNGVGIKAHTAATAFTEMDQHNTTKVEAL